MAIATKSTKEQKIDPRIIERIDAVLKAKGWKPVHLARSLGYSPGWSSYLMNGKRSLDVKMLIKIAEKLEVDPSSLLPDASGKEAPKSFEEYIESIIMEVFEKKIIPRIKKEFNKK